MIHSKKSADVRKAAVWGFSVLTLAFGMSLALAGCDNGSGGGGGGGGGTVLTGALRISDAGPAAADRPEVTETDVNTKLYAVYSEPASLIYQWYQDGNAISGETSEEFTPEEEGSYTVTVTATSDGKSKTSAAVTAAIATAATVSVSVDAKYSGVSAYTPNVDVTLTLSRGAWDIPSPQNDSLKNAFKAAAKPSRYNAELSDIEVNLLNPRAVTCVFNGKYTYAAPPTGEVTVTLVETALAALSRYTTLGSPATLTAGTGAAGDSDWEPSN